MEISEKVAYLKGLAEGLNLDTDSKEGKLIAAIIDVLDDIALELERDAPNEEYIIEKTIEMAALMYEQSNAKLNLTVSLARKLAHAMATQDEFNRDYFTALASYITLGEQGRVVLHTKTETEVTLVDGSNESP